MEPPTTAECVHACPRLSLRDNGVGRRWAGWRPDLISEDPSTNAPQAWHPSRDPAHRTRLSTPRMVPMMARRLAPPARANRRFAEAAWMSVVS